MKSKKIIILPIVVISIVIGIILINYDGNKKVVLKDEKKGISSSSSISMMLETGASTGIYEVSTDSSWPTSGYTFNESLSKCENGSTLVWDSANNQVIMTGNVSDKCYVYFDVKKGSITLYSSIYTGTENNIYFGGVVFYLYQVATYSGGSYIYTEDFKNCTISLDDLSNTEASDVYSYISSNNITQNSEATTIDDGYVVFSDLECGIYLTYVYSKPSGYKSLYGEAILFIIPDSDDNNDLSYTYTFRAGSLEPTD